MSSILVFTGLSIAHDEARAFLDADYRPPIRRGDLEHAPAGATVVIIDGVFDQELAVSPSEIRAALARGVTIFGAASMGALRAAEVPGVIGVGRIYELYATSAIEDDDEVAVVFNPETLQPMCEPMVNVRHAADRLATLGTISRSVADRIVAAGKALPYYARTYDKILAGAGFGGSPERAHLVKLLRGFDLKRSDAISVLELVAGRSEARVAPSFDHAVRRAQPGPMMGGSSSPGHDSVLLWEFGEAIALEDLADFLAFTGKLEPYAERVAAKLCPVTLGPGGPEAPAAALEQARLLARVGRAWQWATEEEVAVTLHDLGISSESVATILTSAARARARAQALARERQRAWLESLRLELFLDDLALKREAARLASLRWLARRGREQGPPRPQERAWAEDRLRRLTDAYSLEGAMELLARWGVSRAAADRLLEDMVLAARPSTSIGGEAPLRAELHPWLADAPKADPSRRFCKPLEEAYAIAASLRPVLGVTRVSMIAGLSEIPIPNAQAFRPDGEWSSTVGSGKSETELGAKVGAILEEAEKWSQEQLSDRHKEILACTASYMELLRAGFPVADPSSLDLPYDTCFSPDLAIDWYRVEDLASGAQVLAPAAAFNHRRLRNDIYYSPRGARKTVTTNGLAAGFTVAEALTHALCEFIERHARTMDFILRENPGAPGFSPRPAIDLATAPPAVQALAEKITKPGHGLFVHEIRSEIQIPTFHATIVMRYALAADQLFGDGLTRASGWAAHPDPETALQMALLEAAQTVVSHIAGAREDLALHARSLGRHERSDCRSAAAFLTEFDASVPAMPLSAVSGFTSPDAGTDVRWLVEQLRRAGCGRVLAMDYSTDRIAPVRVLRVVVPGLETINAFHTGPRARRALVSDLLPRPSG